MYMCACGGHRFKPGALNSLIAPNLNFGDRLGCLPVSPDLPDCAHFLLISEFPDALHCTGLPIWVLGCKLGSAFL